MAVIKCGKCSFDFKVITVEPVLFMYMIGSFLMYPTFQAFIYEKVCLNNYNQSLCDNLHNRTFQSSHKQEVDLIQSATSHWILKKNVAELIPACLVVLIFLGSWGDKVGRKLPVLVPCSGAIVSSLIYLIIAIYPSSKIEYIFIAAVLNGISGAFVALLMSVYSYIAHLVESKDRTIRVGILETMTFSAAFVGVFVSGVMLDNTSFIFVFSFICGANCVAITYAVVRLENIKPDTLRHEGERICDFWFLSSIKESFQCVVKSRTEKRKIYLTFLIVVFVITALGTSAEIDVLFLYTRHPPLSWSPTTFGYYKGLENFSRSVALLTILPLCKRKFSVRDTTLCICGLFSKVVGLVVIGLAKQTWLMFTVVVLAMLQGLPAAGIRSLLSSFVDKGEQGRLFGLVGAVESISSLLASLIFNEIYPASLSFFPGFSFLLAASLCVIGISIMIWLHIDLRGTAIYEVMSENNQTSSNVNNAVTHYGSTEDVRM